MSSSKSTSDRASRILWWMLATAIVVLVLVIRIRLLRIPLERDEGEFAYAGQLILQGLSPYQLCYTMKFPGTPGAYALIMAVFGQTITGIHFGFLLVNLATIAFVFILGRRLFGQQAGLAAAAAYAVLSIDPVMLGLAAHATHFVVLPALIGTLLLIDGLNRQSDLKIFWSGLVFGIAVLMKQPAITYVAFGFVYLLFSKWRSRARFGTAAKASAMFAGASLIPLLLACLVMLGTGSFQRFWLLTVEYAGQYATRVPISQAGATFALQFARIFESTWPLWIMAAAGMVVCALRREYRASGGLVMAFLAFSALALCAGFYFRPHYFILLLPAVSLFCGAAVAGAKRFTGKWRPLPYLAVFLVTAALVLPVFVHRRLFFVLDSDAACRTMYGSNPFPESIRIATYLREHSKPGDTIAVFGSEPQIYFYARRHSATGYIYMYPLMESQKFAESMQREMEREIENARPTYIVFTSIAQSWSVTPASNRDILDFGDAYCTENYEQVGLIVIVDKNRTEYFWDNIPSLTTLSYNTIAVYKRSPWADL